jgi:glutathione synthase
VFHLRPDDPNLNSLLEMFTEKSREPLMVQQYLPPCARATSASSWWTAWRWAPSTGCRRPGEARSNMHVGGTPAQTTLTPREREICEAIGPELKARGMIFVGIDVIGDHLTEINVTSPTGLQEIARFDGVQLEHAIWDAIEQRRSR